MRISDIHVRFVLVLGHEEADHRFVSQQSHAPVVTRLFRRAVSHQQVVYWRCVCIAVVVTNFGQNAILPGIRAAIEYFGIPPELCIPIVAVAVQSA